MHFQRCYLDPSSNIPRGDYPRILFVNLAVICGGPEMISMIFTKFTNGSFDSIRFSWGEVSTTVNSGLLYASTSIFFTLPSKRIFLSLIASAALTWFLPKAEKRLRIVVDITGLRAIAVFLPNPFASDEIIIWQPRPR